MQPSYAACTRSQPLLQGSCQSQVASIMELLQKKHRQEQKDLQSRIAQKKKSATKKTRKGVNDECADSERQLTDRHNHETLSLAQNADANRKDDQELQENGQDNSTVQQPASGADAPLANLSLSDRTDESIDAHTKKPNRQKARLARRAAEQEAAAGQAAKEAENIPDLRAREGEAMQQEYQKRGLKEQPIRPDGHCLYAAVADQLVENDLDLMPEIPINGLDVGNSSPKMAYKTTRNVAASYIAANPDDFVPFLEEPLNTYVQTIRETGEWGGHLELLALARAYVVNIYVLQADGKVETIEGGSEGKTKLLWLAYYRHSYGLGEHYNSLHQVLE